MRPLRRHFAALLVIWSVLGGPITLVVENVADEASDCCPKNESASHDEGDLPCSPLCTDCPCGAGARSLSVRGPLLDVEWPMPTTLARVSPPCVPTDGARPGHDDALLRPPQA